jgi:hypothetical protein
MEESIIRLSAQQGRVVPDKLADVPALNDCEELYWLAFVNLTTQRIPDGFIRWCDICAWADYYGLEEDEREDLVDIVRAMDCAYVAYVNEKRSAKKPEK